jgi:formylglycine-generating enzyme required for sulfatase activity
MWGTSPWQALGVIVLVALASPARGQEPERSGERYALLVGVGEYISADFNPLKFAEDDVVALAGTLQRSGYKAGNIRLLTQGQGARHARYLPFAENIRRELTLLLDMLGEDDHVVVAFAGHGIQPKEGEKDIYFCPSDARIADPKKRENLISLTEVHAKLAACKAGFKLLLVDACRNDPRPPTRDAGLPDVDNIESASAPLRRLPPGGVASFFSCSARETAFEDPGLKHGVFFHFIIQGLEGEADADLDGKVDLEELAGFSKKRVYRFVDATYRHQQTPELLNETRGSVAIVERPRNARFLINTLGQKLVLVTPGVFAMGSEPGDRQADGWEKPRHRVRINRPFYLGATEVTQAQYRALMGQSPSKTQGDDLPVEQVSWLDAVAFCEKLSEKEGLEPYYRAVERGSEGGDGYRLPTEAEWEYACRAGSTARYAHGDDASLLGEYAWTSHNARGKPHPVGQKLPSGFGLFDMHGNVWEWCSDWYDTRYYTKSPVDDPPGGSQTTSRVLRGGAYNSSALNSRAATRNGDAPSHKDPHVGFRVARSRPRP